MDAFGDRKSALEAVGLSEEDAQQLT
jgi:hypothetical protein